MNIHNANKSFAVLSLFILFNLLFLAFIIKKMALPADELVANWRTLQYFFSYDLEFMKRGLIGSLFDIFSIKPTLRTIWFFSLLSCNIVFFLTYNYLKRMFNHLPNGSTWLILFVLFFTISPVTAWNFGYEAGRADLFNLVIALFIINIIVINKKKLLYLIPVLLVIGVLIHEAFIFLSAPTIFALLINEFMRKRIQLSIIIGSFIAILGVFLAIMLFGDIEPASLKSLYLSVYHEPIPTDLPIVNTFMIITSSIYTNIIFTLREYLTLHVWKYFAVALPFLMACFYIYFKSVSFHLLSIEKKILLFSPFLVVPMFIFGVDLYRWFSAMLINMFIATSYLIHTKVVNFSFFKTINSKVALCIIALFGLFGPIGARSSFPYFFEFINKIL